MAEESLDRRIARLEARAEIAELLARYAFLIDDHEFDALGELFTPDARFGSPGSTHVGREAIVANYRALGDLYPITLHEARGFVLDFLDDSRARGQVLGFSEQASARQYRRSRRSGTPTSTSGWTDGGVSPPARCGPCTR